MQIPKQLVGYIEVSVIYKVKCGFCGATWEDEHENTSVVTPNKHAKELLDLGWRELESEEYGAIMIACPSCVEEQTQVVGPKSKLTAY